MSSDLSATHQEDVIKAWAEVERQTVRKCSNYKPTNSGYSGVTRFGVDLPQVLPFKPLAFIIIYYQYTLTQINMHRPGVPQGP